MTEEIAEERLDNNNNNGLTILANTKNIRTNHASNHRYGQTLFPVTACGIPGFYTNVVLRGVFQGFGDLERIKEVVKTTKSGMEYKNGNRVLFFRSLKQVPPRKIYLDSFKLNLVFSKIPSYFLKAENQQDSNQMTQQPGHSQALFEASRRDEGEQTETVDN